MNRSVLAVLFACAGLGLSAAPALSAAHVESGDAGQTRATAQDTAGGEPLSITGDVEFYSADMYRVCATGTSFSVSVAASGDPMLWLFDADGNPVSFNDDYFGLQSYISGATTQGATYYLAVAPYSYGYGFHQADDWPEWGSYGYGMPYTVYTSGLGGVGCPGAANPDTDHDGVNDDVDNCPNDANPGQADNDGDAEGDACDADDGVGTACDQTELPKNKDECKNNGWKNFHDGTAVFKNQGDCVSFVATGGKNLPAGPK